MFKKYFGFSIVLFGIFIVDRFLKNWFLLNAAENFGGIFGLAFRLVKNPGIAFGLSFNQPLLIIITITIVIILTGLLLNACRSRRSWESIALSLLLIGSISNLIDRWRYGFVIDYIDVSWFTVFNIADCLITVGVGILIFLILRIKKAN